MGPESHRRTGQPGAVVRREMDVTPVLALVFELLKFVGG